MNTITIYAFDPLLGILTCGYMMYNLPLSTWTRLLLWMAVGLLIYFSYSKSHSRIGAADARLTPSGD